MQLGGHSPAAVILVVDMSVLVAGVAILALQTPQSSLSATAFGVTFIFGSYSATSTERPRPANFATRSLRQVAHGP